MANTGRLRVGLIGCGFISARHGPAWLAPADAELVAFVACIGHFAHAVRLAEPLQSSARDNLRTLAATLAAYDSVAGGQVVRPPEIPA